MPLTDKDVERLKRVARLADGTEYDGERSKSIMVCINILRDKGGLTFEALIEQITVGKAQPEPTEDYTRSYRTGSTNTRGNAAWGDPDDPNFYEQEQEHRQRSGSYWSGPTSTYSSRPPPPPPPKEDFYDWFGRQEAQRDKEREDFKANEARQKAWDEARRKAAYKSAKHYAHTPSELDTVMNYFFKVYTAEQQMKNLNKGIIDFIVAHTQHSYIMLGEDIRQIVVLRPTENNFMGSMEERSLGGGFDLYLSEKQFSWLIEIYRKVRREMVERDIDIHGKYQGTGDVLYKTFNKLNVPYLR